MAKGSNNLSGRRSRGGKPYDLNNSFVKKVATKVTDLIPQRSWISKWFNSSEDNGEMLNDPENAEYEEFAEEVQQAPPAKRPRIRMDVVHPPGTFNIQLRNKSSLHKIDDSKEQFSNHNETNEDFLEPLAAGPSGTRRLISSTPAIQTDNRVSSSQRSNLNSLTTTQDNGVINGADDNSESSESTSGCSSLIPQNNRQEAPSNASFASNFASKRFIEDKLNYTNHLQSPRSLFLDTSTRDSLSSRRPSFNSSIMSNNLERSTSLSSPFYSGNVTFGGANAAGLCKRSRSLFHSNNEYKLKVPRRSNVQVKPSNSANIDSSGMSQTAKRILEALEHFSSPVLDAKKIPIKNATNLMNSTGRKRSRDDPMSPAPRVGLRHMTRELTVPTVPDLLKIRRRQRLQDTTLAARKIVSAHSGPPLTAPSEYRLRTDTGNDPKFRGKLRAKSKTNPLEEETVEPVNLPTIALPISTLPRFEIALPQYTKPADRNTDRENSFKFASPIKVTDTTKPLKSVNDFTFSSPLNPVVGSAKVMSNDFNISSRTISLDSNESILNSSSTPNFTWSSSTAPRPKEKIKYEELKVTGATDEVKSGSVVDFLSQLRKQTEGSEEEKNLKSESRSKKETNSTNEVAIINSMEKHNETWECSECLIRNEGTTYCTACKSSKSSVKSKKPAVASENVAFQPKPIENDCFGSKFKLSTDLWECSACLVRNKQSDEKCISCSTPKSTTKVANSGLGSDLFKKFKPSGNSWECPGCMVRNDGNVSNCPCCKAVKPSSNVATEGETRQGNASQATKSLESSKPQKNIWECPCCMVRNAGTVTVCPCCKAVKPGSTNANLKKLEETSKLSSQGSSQGFGDKFKKPAGAWTCDSCLISNKAEATECVACTAAKPGTQKSNVTTGGPSLQFSFGVPPKDSGFKFGVDKADEKPEKPASGFTFGSKPAASSTEQFSFGIPKADKDESETVKPTGFTFGQKSTENATGFQFNSKTTDQVAKAEKKSNESIKPAFSFGAPQTQTAKTESTEKSEKTDNTEKKVEKTFSFGASSPPSATTAPTSASSFTFISPKSNKRQAEDESQAKKTMFGGPVTPVQSANVVSSKTTSLFPAPTTTSQATISSPSFSFTPQTTSISASSASPATTTAAVSLPPFSNATFSFSDQSKLAQQPTTLSSFGVPPTSSGTSFSFGASKSTESTTNAEKKSPAASFTSTTSAPLFGSSTVSTPFGGSKPDSPSVFGTVEKKVPLFGGQENKLPAFGETESKSPAFGATDKNIPAFGSSTKQASLFPAATISFGASTTTSPFGSSAPVFGSNSTTGFGSPASSNVFPSSKPNDNNAAQSSNLFSFGSSQPTSSAFNFAAGSSARVTTAQKTPVFAFGGGASTTQPGNNFGANTFSTTAPATSVQPGFSFNAPKPDASPAFGQSATTATPLFGATQPAQQGLVQGQAASPFSTAGTSNPGFSFGSAAPAAPSGGFNFGGMAQAPTPGPAAPAQSNSGFNFNAPNAMSFNFTGGNAPTAFTAPPQLPQPQRKIKTARRRMTPR